MSTQSLGKMAIYGCGGAGTNIARNWDPTLHDDIATMVSDGKIAEVTVNYLDTSRKNLTGEEPESNCYILPNVDGSGKIRSENHPEITKSIKDMVLKHQPAPFNVVVFSASGGTGSVIGPLLVRELLLRGERVVALTLGSSESMTTVENTIRTLKSLDNIARKNNIPVVMAYEDNGNNQNRPEVDGRLNAVISSLGVLTGPAVRELDTADVTHWLQYHKVSSVAPQLSLLDIVVEADAIGKVTPDPISVASLISDPTQNPSGIMPDYATVGYYANPEKPDANYHYVISVDAISRLVEQINETISEAMESRGARKPQPTIVGEQDTKQDDDIIL